jgi:tRNA threonylcarbamoyladenosine biosynthesis protein TsaB
MAWPARPESLWLRGGVMKLMVVDTSLGLCTVGVFEVDSAGAPCLGLRSEPMTKGHSERIAGFASDAAAAAGVSFAQLDRIGVTVGPGSFTGLRVGLAFAQGLAAALDRPLVGISGLDALEASAGEAAEVAALIDARRGQVYARFWRDGAADGPAEALTLEAAAGRIATLADGAVLIGSGAPLFAEVAGGRTVVAPEGPAPEALARLTAAADPALAPARPLYLRAPDATPPTRLPGQARGPAR